MTSRDFRSVPPPKNLNQRQSYTRFEDVHANASQARARFEARINSGTQFSRRPKFGDFEDEYFEHEDDDGHHQPSKSPAKNDGNDDDENEHLESTKKKPKALKIKDFLEDEAELSGDEDEISSDESDDENDQESNPLNRQLFQQQLQYFHRHHQHNPFRPFKHNILQNR